MSATVVEPDSGVSRPTSPSLVEDEARCIVPIYRRSPVNVVRGEGARLFDDSGRSYLDFAAGIAVNALGHGDQELASVVAEQAATLIHTSNMYYTEPQVRLAQQLVDLSFADRVFFCNSGAEANDAALKFARKWARTRAGDSGRQGDFDRTEIVACLGGFHGRTVGSVSVSGDPSWVEMFAPLMGGVSFVPFGDVHAARSLVGPRTCAVIVEPVQGQGGVRPAPPGFLRELRDLCDRTGAALIFDEVQCGMGRTGRLWAHEWAGVEPDIMTVSKALAGGLPCGATLVRESIASVLEPGDHGCTFAGGPLICRAAKVVLDRVANPEFLASVRSKGIQLRRGLERLASPEVVEIRGEGLLVGVECRHPVAPLIDRALQLGLLLISGGPRVLRLCPPLIVTHEEVDRAVAILQECLTTCELPDGRGAR